jgi:hypothetical protein
MNRRRTLLLVIFGLALVCGLAFLFWPEQPHQPMVALKIVRRAFEQGKEVVFFKVVVPDGRRIYINSVERVTADKTDRPFDDKSMKPTADFWAAHTPLMGPIGDPNKGRNEFGVVRPAGMPIWKLRVLVDLDVTDPLMRLVAEIRTRWMLRRAPKNITLTGFVCTCSTVVESGPITNAVAPEAFSKAMQ